MSNIIRIPQIMINHQEKGLSIKNWDNKMDMYASCGHGSHGKTEPIMAITHKIIHTMHKTISILELILNCINFVY